MSTLSNPMVPAVRRSPLRILLQRDGCHLERIDDVEVSCAGSGPGLLTDLSTCDRIGLKGRGSAAWLQSRGIGLPDRPNRLLECPDGLLVARLAESEFLLADFRGARSIAVEEIREACATERPEGVHDVPRAEGQAAFGLSGDGALSVLAAVCPADLRPCVFDRGDVLQTLCAGVGAQLWNVSCAPLTRVIVLCDASVAEHVWEALIEPVRREGGGVGPQIVWFEPR